MKEDVKIVDFEKKFAKQIDAIESAEWTHVPIIKRAKEGFVIKVALLGEEVVGMAYGSVKGDLFIYDVCCIKDGHRIMGIGTELTKSLIDAAKSLGCVNMTAKVLFHNGKMAAEGLMKKFAFRELLRVKNYWKRCADKNCKVCGASPCICTCIFFVKGL